MSSAPPNSPRPIRLLPPLVWVLFLLVLGWFYAWSPTSFPQQLLTDQPVSYYHELTEGFLAGHLYLPRAPDPRLVALPDPYDPAANADCRVNDLSYHAGRYFFYPSAVPVLTLLAPVRLLTGKHLGEPGACLIFSLAGFAAAAAFLLTLRRHFFPQSPAVLVACSLGALALCQGYYVVLRAESYNLVPIACAYCWAMLALLATLRSLVASEREQIAWLATASLAYALAIASRPNYLPGACALLVPILMWWRASGWRLSRRLLGHLLAVGLPMAAIACALLAYNFVRFDTPWEFGMRLQLGAWDQRAMSGLSLGNVPENAYHYLVGPGLYHPSFPFVTAPSWTALGVLPHVPFALLALLLPWLMLARQMPWPARAALTLPLLVTAANLGFLLFFPSGNEQAVRTSANARYLFDFLPAWVLLASGCVVAASALISAQRGPRRLLGLGTTVALTLSVLAALSLDFSRYPPEAYRPLAWLFSRPTWCWEQARGIEYGPVELQVVLPADKIGAYEPLLATGTAKAGDLVYIFYEGPGQIRIGLVGTETPGPLSESIKVDYAQPHRLEFRLGSLYPPVSHPAMAEYGEAQLATIKRRLVVRLDGQSVLDVPAFIHPGSNGRFKAGAAPFLRAYSDPSFRGRILAVRRLPFPTPAVTKSAPVYGAARLELLFPIGGADRTEPLVVTGIPQAGNLLSVSYQRDRSVRFNFDHWGHRGVSTDWLPIDFAAVHTLEISFSSLFPPDSRQWRDKLQIILDGRKVLDVAQPAYESSPYDVVFGRNVIGSSTASYAFTGRILRLSRPPPAP